MRHVSGTGAEMTGWNGGCEWPQGSAVVSTGYGGAPRGPEVLPRCATASPGPATLGSLKPGHEDAG